MASSTAPNALTGPLVDNGGVYWTQQNGDHLDFMRYDPQAQASSLVTPMPAIAYLPSGTSMGTTF